MSARFDRFRKGLEFEIGGEKFNVRLTYEEILDFVGEIQIEKRDTKKLAEIIVSGLSRAYPDEPIDDMKMLVAMNITPIILQSGVALGLIPRKYWDDFKSGDFLTKELEKRTQAK